MEFLVEMIRVNAFDPRIWIILICIPLLLVRMVYVSIKRKNSWGISGIFYKLIPFLLLIFGGLFVFGHIMGILSSQFVIIGGFLIGAGGIINGLFLRLEMKKEKDSNHIIQKSSIIFNVISKVDCQFCWRWNNITCDDFIHIIVFNKILNYSP
jgi:hypothetical protein